LGAGFMSWDDAQYVLDNKDIQCWHNFSAWFHNFYIGNYHPLTMFSYAIDYAIGVKSPVVYISIIAGNIFTVTFFTEVMPFLRQVAV